MCGRSGIARSHSFRVSGPRFVIVLLLVIVIESYAAAPVVAKFSSTRYGVVSTRFSPGIVKEIVLSSAASVLACSAVSSTSGGRTFAHAGSFA